MYLVLYTDMDIVALIWSEKECTAAAVYTTNKVGLHSHRQVAHS